MNPGHPPLPKGPAALPIVLRGMAADHRPGLRTIRGRVFPAYMGQWVFGEWVLERWNDPKAMLKWARLPMLIVTLLLGCTLYILARRLGGPWGGLLCLSLFVSMPAFLAFGPVVHTDIAIALFSLLAL